MHIAVAFLGRCKRYDKKHSPSEHMKTCVQSKHTEGSRVEGLSAFSVGKKVVLVFIVRTVALKGGMLKLSMRRD